MTPHRVKVEGGVVRFEDRAEFERCTKRLPDGEYAVILDIPDTIRTYLQNRYYWGGVIRPISAHTGFSPQEIHAMLKVRFPPKTGDSTASETTKEFTERIEAVRQWAAESLDVQILTPDEWREREMQKQRVRVGPGVWGASRP